MNPFGLQQIYSNARLLLACTAMTLLGFAASSEAYIGGWPVPPNGLPAVVTFDLISCTSVKVGPRQFLMAAHCVQPVPGPTLVRAGDALKILSHTAPPAAPRTAGRAPLRADNAHIRSIAIHPSYLQRISKVQDASEILARPGVIDLALLEVDTDTPAIAVEPLRVTPLSANEPVLVGGYGAMNAASRPSYQLRAAWKRVILSSATTHYVTDLDADQKAHSMGWEGDSGGPVHALGFGNRLEVAGINSYVTGVIWLRGDGTLDNPQETGMTHFVRLDHPQARTWLRQLGLIAN